jgi:Holliday junction resolvasome RuvABC endonuclease subunit
MLTIGNTPPAPAKAASVIWGLDPSTNTGLVIMDSHTEQVIHACNIQLDPRERPTKDQRAAKVPGRLVHPVERVRWYGDQLRILLAKFGAPALIVIEDYGFAPSRQSVDTIITQCYVGFVLRDWCRSNGVPYIEIPPTTLKSFVGASKKEQVMMLVLKRWGHTSKTNDQADAYVLAQIGRHAMGLVASTAEERKALLKLKDDEVISTYVPPGLVPGLYN